jgi:hypothetical protein
VQDEEDSGKDREASGTEGAPDETNGAILEGRGKDSGTLGRWVAVSLRRALDLLDAGDVERVRRVVAEVIAEVGTSGCAPRLNEPKR